MDYNLEMERVIKTIKKEKASLVCIQLPDGLKPKAKEITDEITNKTNAKVLIWAASCFGSCDVPALEKFKADLLIQFGHSKWK